MSKISIRFFDDKEARAVWDEENSKWWFSVVDKGVIKLVQWDMSKRHNIN